MRLKNIFLILLSTGLLFSCSDEISGTSEVSLTHESKKIVQRDVDPKIYSQGRKLFLVNCVDCHGSQGEGEKDWRKPDVEGKNSAPPLNGTGHTWHHSGKSLANTIKNGTIKIGGKMPAWKDKLTDREIKLILTWITAQWPDEIYTAWYNRFHQNK